MNASTPHTQEQTPQPSSRVGKRPSSFLFLYCETPVHCGGGSSLGGLDLPMQRSVTTQLPIIHGSSMKGALREHFRGSDEEERNIFGKEIGGSSGADTVDMANEDGTGWLAATDAMLLAFPVPSLDQSFRWVTCAETLNRLARLRRAGAIKNTTATTAVESAVESTEMPSEGFPDVGLGADSILLNKCYEADQYVLSDFVFDRIENEKSSDHLGKWAKWISKVAFPRDLSDPKWGDSLRKKFETDLALVSQSAFAQLTKSCAELRPRVSLGKSKVVNQLWNEEHVPPDAVFVTLCSELPTKRTQASTGSSLDDEKGKFCDNVHDSVFTIGGLTSTGKGLVWAYMQGDIGPQTSQGNQGASAGEK